jgi:hypothetical protein
LKPWLYIPQCSEDAVDIRKEAHHFDPMKQMSKQECFRQIVHLQVVIRNIDQVLVPQTTGVAQVLWEVFFETCVKIKDLRIEFSRVIDCANVALESVHGVETADCEFAIVFISVNEEMCVSAAARAGEKVSDGCVEKPDAFFVIQQD